MASGAMPMKQASDTRGAVVALVVGGLVALVAACGQGNGGQACLPEDVERCTCADGRPGFFVCDPEGGTGYGACNCDLDASPYLPEAGEADASEGGASDGGGPGWMDPCSQDPAAPQCPPGTSCLSYPSKGPHCSKQCAVATDCPPPSPGCNPQGQCKVP